jgi:hypothetical protein
MTLFELEVSDLTTVEGWSTPDYGTAGIGIMMNCFGFFSCAVLGDC